MIYRFDLNTKNWLDIQNSNYYNKDIVQINELLYFFDFEMECEQTFNLISETWQTIPKIQIPKTLL